MRGYSCGNLIGLGRSASSIPHPKDALTEMPDNSSNSGSATSWSTLCKQNPLPRAHSSNQASGSPSTGAFHRGSTRLLADNSCSRLEPFLLCSWWAQHCPCLAQLCRSLASMLTGDGLHRQAGGITEKGTHWDSNPFPKGTATKQPQPQPCSTCSQAQPCSWPANTGAGYAPPCASQLPTLKTAFQT